MTSHPIPWQPVLAVLGLGAIVGAVCLLWLAESDVAVMAAPTTNLPPVERLSAAAPRIDGFAAFNVNAENPFVPYNLRQAETAKIAAIRRPRAKAPPPVARPAIVVPPTIPDLTLPRLTASESAAPVCIGVVGSSGGAKRLFVRLPPALLAQAGTGAAAERYLEVGDTVAGWTLDGIDGIGTARFRDERGAEHVFPIGTSARDPGSVPPPPARPMATPSSAVRPATAPVQYVVKPGDTVDSVIGALGIGPADLGRLMEANPGLNPADIRPGTVIKLPQTPPPPNLFDEQAAKRDARKRKAKPEAAPKPASGTEPADGLFRIPSPEGGMEPVPTQP